MRLSRAGVSFEARPILPLQAILLPRQRHDDSIAIPCEDRPVRRAMRRYRG